LEYAVKRFKSISCRRIFGSFDITTTVVVPSSVGDTIAACNTEHANVADSLRYGPGSKEANLLAKS
jgi:hypothetical protein